jgi:hypothetical protein
MRAIIENVNGGTNMLFPATTCPEMPLGIFIGFNKLALYLYQFYHERLLPIGEARYMKLRACHEGP